ncbi:MAG: RNA-binding S4 domain-containing protein [Actinomycetia bacterium]|nr:RNA-binding S4 domain-containing protein [Actinomycetes bacterium]
MAQASGSSVRVDVWLFSVRAYRTRTAATEACRTGKVRVDGDPAKAAQRIAPGAVIEFRRGGDTFVFEVVELISKRVGAPRAEQCRIDRSPPRVREDSPLDVPAAERHRGTGRPTKRDRRQIESFTRRR